MVEGEKMAYYDVGGVWFALNVQQDISRNEIEESYTHLAFAVTEEELEEQKERFQRLGLSYTHGRPRDKEHEGDSIYFRDPDGHLFEFHTGSLEGRIQYYKDEKKPMTFTD
ncbi:fosfomycin resistance protein FosB [Geomicrobium sp. JCM 19055]|nr:fosfomycin resistance protein FosB [Geomicrobium sp. JCM 19055]